MQFNLKRILKSLLFSTSESLSIRDIQAVITRYHEQAEPEAEEPEPIVNIQPPIENPNKDSDDQSVMQEIFEQVPSLLTATQIRDAMDNLAQELKDKDEVYRLVQGPAGYRLTTAPDFAEWVRLLRNEAKPMRLSRAAMETLAIIAYRQPVTRAEMEAIRGVSIDSAINKLLELDLVLITGRAELPGRPIQYGTTEKFLEFIGIRSIEELPASDVLSPGQISEWIRKATSEEEPISDKDVGLPEENTDAAETVVVETNSSKDTESEAENTEESEETVAENSSEDASEEENEKEPITGA